MGDISGLPWWRGRRTIIYDREALGAELVRFRVSECIQWAASQDCEVIGACVDMGNDALWDGVGPVLPHRPQLQRALGLLRGEFEAYVLVFSTNRLSSYGHLLSDVVREFGSRVVALHNLGGALAPRVVSPVRRYPAGTGPLVLRGSTVGEPRDDGDLPPQQPPYR